jgi:ABC-type Fe3+ transport system substrate-binding protein
MAVGSMATRLSRRGFIRLAGISGAAVVVGACQGAGQPAVTAGASASAAADALMDFVRQQMPGVTAQLIQAARAEGTVVVYAGTFTDSTTNLIKGFNRRFPDIKVETFSAGTAELRQRFLAEENAGKHLADTYTETDTGTLRDFATNGRFMNYKISTADAYSPAVTGPGYWYPLRVAMTGIAWNTNLVSDADAKILSDWKGVTDARWKGKGGIVDPALGGVAYLPFYAWDKLYGGAFVQQVAALKPRVFSSTNPASAALASGDIAVYLNASETGLYPLYLQGAPIKWSLPTPGVGPVTGQGISAKAPHPNAAKLWQEYTFSLEGYKLWQEFTGIPARIGLSDQRKVASESWYKLPTSFFDYDPADATRQSERVVRLYKTAP